MAHVAELDWPALVVKFLNAQTLWRAEHRGSGFELSGAAMRAFCKWLVSTGRATEREVWDLKQRVVRVYEHEAAGVCDGR